MRYLRLADIHMWVSRLLLLHLSKLLLLCSRS